MIPVMEKMQNIEKKKENDTRSIFEQIIQATMVELRKSFRVSSIVINLNTENVPPIEVQEAFASVPCKWILVDEIAETVDELPIITWRDVDRYFDHQ